MAREGDPAKSGRASSLVLGMGDRFGGPDGQRFLVEDLAGRGAQAQVYRVRDTRLERLVAAKVCLAPEARYREYYQRRFERELRLGSRLQHPHVLAVYDCGELSDGAPYMIQEWAERGTLTKLVGLLRAVDRRLPQTFVLDYAFSLAQGLGTIHRADVLHRDLKPDNLLLSSDGVLKIGDFGLAKDLSEQAEALTSVGSAVGTNGFMAPEQVAGLAGPQSDYFSLGITIAYLLSGEVLPQGRRGGHPDGVVREEAFQLVPIWWRDQIRRLCAPTPLERPSDLEEVLELLRSVQPPPDSPWPEGKHVLPPRSRTRWDSGGPADTPEGRAAAREDDPDATAPGRTTASPFQEAAAVVEDVGSSAPVSLSDVHTSSTRGKTALSTPAVRTPSAGQTVASLDARGLPGAAGAVPTESPMLGGTDVSMQASSAPVAAADAAVCEEETQAPSGVPGQPTQGRRWLVPAFLLLPLAVLLIVWSSGPEEVGDDVPEPEEGVLSGGAATSGAVRLPAPSSRPPVSPAEVEGPPAVARAPSVPSPPAPPAAVDAAASPPAVSAAAPEAAVVEAPDPARAVASSPAPAPSPAAPSNETACGDLDLSALGRAPALEPADEACLLATAMGRRDAPPSDIQDAALILFNNRVEGWQQGVEHALGTPELRNAPNLHFASLPGIYRGNRYDEVVWRAGVVWQNLDKGYRRSLADRALTAELACRSAVQLALSGQPEDDGLDWCERWLEAAAAQGLPTREAEELLEQLE